MAFSSTHKLSEQRYFYKANRVHPSKSRGDVLAKAFVLLNAETGSEKDVVEKVRTLKNVKEAYFVFGVYDVIAIVEAPNIDELRNTIHNAMRQIRGIRSTCTMVVIK